MSQLKYENNILRFENIDIDEIAKTHQTPFYCYSKNMLTNNFNNFNNVFLDLNYKICFSLKSNSNLTLLRILASYPYEIACFCCCVRKVLFVGLSLV